MQTFLPYPNFQKSARSLDNKRLGKQRSECKQILKALIGGPYQVSTLDGWISCDLAEYCFQQNPELQYRKTPWYNHPAVQMWKGYEDALAEYGFGVCREWQTRGYADTLESYFLQIFQGIMGERPPWAGNDKFHASHKSNLLRKDPEHYGQFNWDVPDDLPYIWPTKDLT